MFDWIADFFSELFNLIPKVIYLLYSSFISIIDLIQALFRKLAGLDIYYVDGKPINGDIVTNFITGILGINDDNLTYSVLSTVFWSFVIFGLIICFLATLVAIVKSHYSYNEKSAKGPLPIVATAGKAVLNMIAVPVIIVLGLYLSEAILTALDDMTSVGSSDIISIYGEDKVSDWLQGTDLTKTSRAPSTETDENGRPVTTEKTYIYYDMFGYSGNVKYGEIAIDAAEWILGTDLIGSVAARSQPFSGSIFKIAGYNANRVRTQEYKIDQKFTGNNSAGNFDLFADSETSEQLANKIDTAFANFLHIKTDKGVQTVDYSDSIRIDRYFTNFLTKNLTSFSKFNVGLVWYYYDLWNFNFIVGFGAGIVCLSIFINIVLGLMSRLFMCVVLFLVMPPLAGLAPLDEGKAFKGWREAFTKQVLMAYGAVVGMNLMLLILPYINEIDFFNIPIADLVVQTLFIIVGLITIKAVISTLSGLIGAEDANAAGDKINKEVGSTIGKATAMTVGAAKLGGKAFMNLTPAGIGMKAGAKAFMNSKAGQVVSKAAKRTSGAVKGFIKGGVGGARAEIGMQRAQEEMQQAEKEKFIQGLNGQNLTGKEVQERAEAAGFTKAQAKNMARAHANANGLTDANGKLDLENRSATVNAGRLKRDYNQQLDSRGNVQRDRNGNVKRPDRQFLNYMGTASNQDARTEGVTNRYNTATNIRNYRMAHPGIVGGAIGGAFKTAGAIGGQMLGNYGTALKSTPGGKELRDAVMPAGPNWDKVNADNTAKVGEKMDALNKSITELANELRRRP